MTSQPSQEATNAATDPQENVRENSTASNAVDDDDHTNKWRCICGGGDAEDWVLCGNSGCPIKWYHWECVDLTDAPVGFWLCPHCGSDTSSRRRPLFPNLGTGSRAALTVPSTPVQPTPSKAMPQRKGVAVKKAMPKKKPKWKGWEELSAGEEEAFKAAVEELWKATVLPQQRRSSVQVPAVAEAEESYFIQSGDENTTPPRQQPRAGRPRTVVELEENTTDIALNTVQQETAEEESGSEFTAVSETEDSEDNEKHDASDQSKGSEITEPDEQAVDSESYDADNSSEDTAMSDAGDDLVDAEMPDDHLEHAETVDFDQQPYNPEVPKAKALSDDDQLPNAHEHSEGIRSEKPAQQSDQEWNTTSDETETIQPDEDSEIDWETTTDEVETVWADEDSEGDWTTTSEEIRASEAGKKSDDNRASVSEELDVSNGGQEPEEISPSTSEQTACVNTSDDTLPDLSAYDSYLYSTIPR